jgi:hypothetical protein
VEPPPRRGSRGAGGGARRTNGRAVHVLREVCAARGFGYVQGLGAIFVVLVLVVFTLIQVFGGGLG